MLKWIQECTKNEYIEGSSEVAPVTEKLRGNSLAWYGEGKGKQVPSDYNMGFFKYDVLKLLEGRHSATRA